ncbi:DNA polymerase/3'-5' exonuclease PolX [Chitinophaga sp. HK235]|uniref:DNA polymerase/3'-5' exonuclease PolX n=1 Tax=Chitinophaga sp. HK235 TaxID=2952571 RepID=UPI001BA7ED14|nr:DNA polymerase/3'-5' exonuclease PolX [Chitinophaga sp. HK235]
MIQTTENTIKQNATVARLLHHMASGYKYLGTKERFRAIAYEIAARTVNNLQADISAYAEDKKALDQLNGIGSSIAEKIIEYLKTGKVKKYEELKEQIPEELLDMMDITGFGPALVKVLHEQLDINTRAELLKAIDEGRLEGIKGFGDKKIENIKRGLHLFEEAQSRLLLWDAVLAGNKILQAIRQFPEVRKAELAGSVRRGRETVGDIDIIVMATLKDQKKLADKTQKLPGIVRVLAGGDTKVSLLLQNQTQVDVRIVTENAYGAALLYFTGSKEHNVRLRTIARERGWKLNEYGLFDLKTDKYLAGKTEEEMYRYMGLQFIPPELREDKGEIDLAAKNKLPALVTLKDIKGDMHLHSKWSDGEEEIETLARYVMKTFPQYEYLVMTDHSPSERISHGLEPDDFVRQFREIDQVNKKIGRDFIKKGVEVDILADGQLDLPDDLLEKFDWVVASIHSGLAQDNTQRLLKACEHPAVNCIGHPGGRLVGTRDAYPVNWRQLIDKAATTGTALEINAQPGRMDLQDDLVKMAIDKGVQLVIDTDAHAKVHFDLMQLGVTIARRGWCKKQDVLNTISWREITQFSNKKNKTKRKH